MTWRSVATARDGNDPSTRTPSAWERSAPIACGHGRIVRRGRRGRRRTCSARARAGAGRDSMRVRLTSRSANSDRQRTSQPGRSSLGSQNTSAVFHAPAAPGSRRLAARSTRSASRCPAGPRRPTRSTDAAVELGGRAAPERRPRLAVLALRDQPHGVGGRGGGDHRGARQPGAQEAGALAAGLRVRRDGGDPLERDRLARDQAVVDRVDELAGDLDVVGLERERVERRR